MLELSKIAEWLETKLNEQLSIHIHNTENTKLKSDRVVYMFRVYADQGEHKGFDYIQKKGFDYIDLNNNISIEKTNFIVRYIEAILTQSDSSVEATNYIDITRNTTLEILVPLNDIDKSDIDIKEQVVEEIRNVIDTTFSKNGRGTLDNGEAFSFEYSLSSTGIRNTRAFVGDSITLLAYINFYFVQDSLSPTDVTLQIDGEQIVPIRFTMSQGTTSNTNTFSDDSRAMAMNTPTASVFSINFDLVARKGRFYKELYRRLITGKSTDYTNTQKSNVAYDVGIYIQVGNEEIYTVKLMNIESISMSGQNPLIPSLSVTMNEVKYIEGLTNISDSAEEVLDTIIRRQT